MPKKKVEETNTEQTQHKPEGGFAEGNTLGNRFKPGVSGNPNGRRNALSDLLRESLDAEDEKEKKAIVAKLLKLANTAKGELFLKTFDRVMDRTEGKAHQTIKQNISNINHAPWNPENGESMEDALTRMLRED